MTFLHSIRVLKEVLKKALLEALFEKCCKGRRKKRKLEGLISSYRMTGEVV